MTTTRRVLFVVAALAATAMLLEMTTEAGRRLYDAIANRTEDP
jgi:hypothetical protein